ncbi:hypothetical protein GJ654_08745 [Rhodoblastus acidophilus]|uniref:Uncharacterized protein n=1 Tax=Rhodoblastus acidophilus TaxID=1074 RepID=A0A6N8DKH4_RHOAC|nr:hypothetical protein [Rhodoblastus acidophilus]MCW2274469.1 hypothetical protein [Rhodoblastus acidophilus]MTV31080.1 hypothetical protein [Rhodoblastus acidophilus]
MLKIPFLPPPGGVAMRVVVAEAESKRNCREDPVEDARREIRIEVTVATGRVLFDKYQ